MRKGNHDMWGGKRLLLSGLVAGGMVACGGTEEPTIDHEATQVAFEYKWWTRADEMVGESHMHYDALYAAFDEWVDVASAQCDIKDGDCIQGLPEWGAMMKVSFEWADFVGDAEWAEMIYDGPEPENDVLREYRDAARAMARQWVRELESRDLTGMEALDDEYIDALNTLSAATDDYFER